MFERRERRDPYSFSREEIAALDATLRPCPHCGPMPAMPELVLSDMSKRWQVFCGPCGSSSGSTAEPQQAVEGWNSRHHNPPEIGTTSAARTQLAILLGNHLEDLAPSTKPPIYGFSSEERQAQAYALANDIIMTLNLQRLRTQETSS